MLYGTFVTKVVVEHRSVDAVDDVVVYYAPPGLNENGTTVAVDFYQVKFHVAQTGAVDHNAVIDPGWTGTKQSLLDRFCGAWKEIRALHPTARLNLVTNWPWDPTSPLASLIRDGGRLDDKFFQAGPASKVGRVRVKWQAACGLPDNEFIAFVKSLRFSTSAVSQSDAEAWLRDRCQLAGLVPIDTGVDWSPYDDLGKRLIESGRTEHTPESLRRLVSEQRLVQASSPPFKSTFAVRSFRRFGHVPATDGACVVDLTDLFTGRWPTSENSWSGEICQRLEICLPSIQMLGQPVYLALDAHLSIAWYVGYLLDSKAGIAVVLRQPIKGKGVELWDVSEPRRPACAAGWTSTLEKVGAGHDLAVVASVTHSALTDAKAFIMAELPTVGSILYVALPELGPHVVQDGGHARWIADELVRAVGVQVAELRPERVHMFPACPASLMFLIGQEARALGPTTVYEYAFGHASRAYRPGMTTAFGVNQI